MKLVFVSALLLGSAAAAPAPAYVTSLQTAVESSLARCGLRPALSGPLGNVAADLLTDVTLDQSLQRHGYRPYVAQAWESTYYGDLAWIRKTMEAQCSKWQGFKEYGLATNGEQMGLVLATPGQVDLSQSRRWLNDFLAVTNQARARRQTCGGKVMNPAPPLRWDSRLSSAAARHAQDMVNLNFRGHVNPKDGSGPLQRAQRYGFRGSVGENIQYGSITAAEAVRHLLTSPGHCENLMRPEWRVFGAAVTNGNGKSLFTTYWVQEFGAE